MFKTVSFWLIAAFVVAIAGGAYFLGYDQGVSKGMSRIEEYHEKMVKVVTKQMQEEHSRQMDFIQKIEPVIEERIVEREKIVTEYEQVLVDSPDSCVEHPDRVSAYNSLVRKGNSELPARSDEGRP